MRRRALLSQDVIEASREFVCVRLNAWLDQRNVERVVRLQGFHQNSVLALLPPDAPGLTRDGFPEKAECFWGPFDFKAPDVEEPWHAVHDRIDWMPTAMRRLRRMTPARDAAGPPVMPRFPDLTQALNIAACDSRAVVVQISEDDDRAAYDALLAPLLFEPAVIGRVHAVRVTAGAFGDAVADGQLRLAERPHAFGLAVVAPDAYGLDGTVLARRWMDTTPTAADTADLRDTLHEGLATFAATFRKKDRSRHILEGRAAGIRWEEVDATGWKSDRRERDM